MREPRPDEATQDDEDTYDAWELLPEELDLEPRSLWQRARPWLLASVVIAAAWGLAFVAGNRYYDPEARIPYFAAEERGLYGLNGAVLGELDLLREEFPEGQPVELEPFGDVQDVAFPRTVADRLFGERDEQAVVFYARDSGGAEHRFLVLLSAGRPLTFAVEMPSMSGRGGGPQGLFLIFAGESHGGSAEFGALAEAVAATMDEVDELPAERLSSEDYTIFGPFARGDPGALRSWVESNLVLGHLAAVIDEAGGDVSAAAPVLLIRPSPERGFVNALYQPNLRVMQEPLWREAGTDSLAHELAHAYIDTVLAERGRALARAVEHFSATHPRLYGEVVGDLYQSLGTEGRAEEALAFVTGAVAAGQTKTVATARLLENQGNLSISEPILRSDIELLVEIGLMPDCMSPAATGFDGIEVTFQYYEGVRDACSDLQTTIPD